MFLQSEKIEGDFDIVFISIADGVVETGHRVQGVGYSKDEKTLNAKPSTLNPNTKLPPKNFPSGRSWISKEVKVKMAENITEYLHQNGNKYNTKIAYARGSYLEATKLASQKSGIEIKEIFTENELTELKKKGIMWMKVGLRMSDSFEIFKKRIRGLVRADARKQLSLFL